MNKILQLAAIWLAVQVSASACTVPVFRYALERWPVSPYIALVIADDPLTTDEQRAIDQLEKTSDGTVGSLNLMVRQWTSKQLAESSLAGKVPKSVAHGARLHLFFPRALDVWTPFWSGALSGDSVQKIIGSPARKQLIQKILSGDSGVFMLLESGNKEKDAAAAKALDISLAKKARELALPSGLSFPDGEVIGDGPSSFDPSDRLESPIPLNVAFSTMRLSHEDVDEILVAQLLNLPENENVSIDEPMVFAVYGRGRAVSPLVGVEEISSDLIGYITAFLTGSCSCQVKSMNPGADLLLDQDWERSVFDRE
ncbi:hypothetical protein [Pontiella sulfatireligans]|uniref:Lipoprotein n=1 Tax=Pontiella sulfatireligans TaxID=2750658 RepID=A0A6C2UNK3_9BACT|nr:hypothetical protein [Pontiella sulfatireligans]VGO21860.1 hypothetical protein SCARR_03940 [Pontiella sulfatireligans]